MGHQHQVRLHRQAIFKSKRNYLDRHAALLRLASKLVQKPRSQLGGAGMRGVDHHICPGLQGLHQYPFLANRLFQRVCPAQQRMAAPGLFVPSDQSGVIRIQEYQFIGHAALVQLIKDLVQVFKKFSAPDIHHQGQLCSRVLVLEAQFNEFRNKSRGKIIYAKIAQIFQRTHHLRFPRAGHPCDE